MTVPILWLAHPEETPTRGYWDQAFFEDLFDGRWSPAGFRDPVHHEVRDLSPFAGQHAVVILPARHHVDIDYFEEDEDGEQIKLEHYPEMDWLNEQLAHLAGVVLVLTGDEEQRFLREKVVHDSICFWVMSPHPDAAQRDVDKRTFYVGSGYTPHSREAAGNTDRPNAWSFSGQVTHERRYDAVDVMYWMQYIDKLPAGVVLPSLGFTQGLPYDEYVKLLGNSEIVVCPSGPVCADNFRAYEALEQGAVPVVDEWAAGRDDRIHWELVTGSGHKLPFPSVVSWDDLPKIVDEVHASWPIVANHTGTWWQSWCWAAARRLRDDLTFVGAPPVDSPLTVIITTSPTEDAPNISHLNATIKSIRCQVGDAVPLVLAVDGVRPEQHHLGHQWDVAVHDILHRARHVWKNVEVVYDGGWRHQAGMVSRALDRVETPVVLFSEHDTPLVTDRELPIPYITEMITEGTYDLIRLHHEARVLKVHKHLMLGDGPEGDVWPTIQWSQRPHFASTAYYRDVLALNFTADSRTMIEDTMHSVVQTTYDVEGQSGWNRHRLGIYHPEDKRGIKRSTHLDARGSESKFEMKR